MHIQEICTIVNYRPSGNQLAEVRTSCHQSYEMWIAQAQAARNPTGHDIAKHKLPSFFEAFQSPFPEQLTNF